MARPLTRFPHNDIISLTQEAPTYDLAESVGLDLRLGDLLQSEDMAEPSALPLSYRAAAGDPALCALLAKIHGVTAEEVLVTTGGMQTLFLAAFILCQPGDDAVTTRPLFPNSLSSPTAIGAKVTELPLGFAQGYRLDLAALSAALTPKTRLVGLASPQNPSDVAVPQETLEVVLDAMPTGCPR